MLTENLSSSNKQVLLAAVNSVEIVASKTSQPINFLALLWALKMT